MEPPKTKGASPLAANDEVIAGPFYHGTKADLKPGDLITPGYRSNYGHGDRTIAWVYMSAILSPWAAELARGDGPGRIYIVEPTGPLEDDPDLTDKKFAGNPTKSYRSREPLRVVREVTEWQGHSPEEIKAMTDGLARLRAEQDERVAQIPTEAMFDQIRARADEAAREWAPDSEHLGCILLMLMRGRDVEVFSTMAYRSEARDGTHTIELPHSIEMHPAWQGEVSQSGSITAVTAWHDAWVAVIESCITEIGLSLETRLWIAVDSDSDRLTFHLDADGPERSWQRDLQLVRGVLADTDHGDTWDFGTSHSP
jgi:hypothetical protein